MNKQDLKDIIGEDIGCWEIVSADYNKKEKYITLKLNEFVWIGVFHGRDYKEYLNNIKTVKILDKYAFKYFEDDKYVDSVSQFIAEIGGFNLNVLQDIFNNPELYGMSEIQSKWLNIMLKKGCINKEEYKIILLEELKKAIIYYYKNNSFSKVEEIVSFIEDIYRNVITEV